MSQPAEKMRSPAAVTMPTRRSGSSRKRTKASPRSRLAVTSMAFTFGRSSVTSSTWPRRSTRTASLMSTTPSNERAQYHGAAGRENPATDTTWPGCAASVDGFVGGEGQELDEIARGQEAAEQVGSIGDAI